MPPPRRLAAANYRSCREARISNVTADGQTVGLGVAALVAASPVLAWQLAGFAVAAVSSLPRLTLYLWWTAVLDRDERAANEDSKLSISLASSDVEDQLCGSGGRAVRRRRIARYAFMSLLMAAAVRLAV